MKSHSRQTSVLGKAPEQDLHVASLVMICDTTALPDSLVILIESVRTPEASKAESLLRVRCVSCKLSMIQQGRLKNSCNHVRARSVHSANTRGGGLLMVLALPRRPALQQRAGIRAASCTMRTSQKIPEGDHCSIDCSRHANEYDSTSGDVPVDHCPDLNGRSPGEWKLEVHQRSAGRSFLNGRSCGRRGGRSWGCHGANSSGLWRAPEHCLSGKVKEGTRPR